MSQGHALLPMVPPRRGDGAGKGRTELLEAPGNSRPELHGPAADRLIADVYPGCGHQLLDVAQTQTKTEADRSRRETMAF